jgi:hypothetical protein
MKLEFFRGAFEPRPVIALDDDDNEEEEEEEEEIIRRPRAKRAKTSSTPPKKAPVIVQVPLPEDMSHVKEHLLQPGWKGSWSSRAAPKVPLNLPEWAADAVLYAGCSLTFDLPKDMELDPDDVQEGHLVIWKEKTRSLSFLGIYKGTPWLHFDAQEERLPTVLSALTDALQAQVCFLQGTLSPHPSDLGKGVLTLHMYLTAKVFAGGAFEPIARLVHLVENWDLVLSTDWAQEQDYLYMVPDTYPPAAQNAHIQPAALQAELLPYQKRAIAWMMEREHVEFESPESSVLKRLPEFDPIYHKSIKMADGNTFHIDPFTGFLLPNDPEQKVMGGVLADEMGLGKTVMMMSLILLHPCSYTSYPSLEDFETYKYSAADYVPLPTPLTHSAATLIVTPATILYQWISEIKRHAPKLRYHVYTYKQRFDEITDLSDYDIVLTTYTDLNRELNVAEPPPNRSRRQKLQYERRVSILASILWWRGMVLLLSITQHKLTTHPQSLSMKRKWSSQATVKPLKWLEKFRAFMLGA